jgi:hypothetical protein
MRSTNVFVATVLFLISLGTAPALAQQDGNLFPEEEAYPGGRNTFPGHNTPTYPSAAPGVGQGNDTFPGTTAPVHETAKPTTGAWSRFFRPPQFPKFGADKGPQPSLLERWNASTRQFMDKTKKALTPPKMAPPKFTPPKLSLPRLGSKPKAINAVSQRKSSTKGNSLFSSWLLPKKKEAPPKPRTPSEWIGLDRPE